MTHIETKSARVEGKGQTCDYVEQLSADYRSHVRGGKINVLRIRIHVDTYADQAWGTVERWSGSAWSRIADVRGDALRTDLTLGYAKIEERIPAAFKADRDALLRLAEEVLVP